MIVQINRRPYTMRVVKNLLFVLCFILFPILCFSHTMKPYLLFKVSSESLVLDNTNIKDAHMVKNDDGSYSLDIELTAKAAKQIDNISAANTGKIMSIFYGSDKLIFKASIQSSLGSQFQISHFPEKEG